MNDLDVRKIRESLGYTQEEFGNLIGVSRNTVMNYEKGGTIPKSKRQILNELITNKHNIVQSDSNTISVAEPQELYSNKNGNVYYERNDKLYISVKLVPVKAFGSYLSEYQDSDFYESLEHREFRVDHMGRGNYICFEVEGNSMDGGNINDAPAGAELLCRELGRQHWKDGFRDSIYGWVIVHNNTVVFKDITDFNPETGDIVCSSRSGLPQHPDFTINLNDVRQIWKVIKRSF